MFTILFFGDICGEVGRDIIKKYLPMLKTEYKADIVIANGENATHGRGLALKNYLELIENGVDLVTMGNHYAGVESILSRNEEYKMMIRPANFSKKVPGVGYKTIYSGDKTVLVINLLGQAALPGLGQNNPFDTVDRILESEKADIIFVDFHAEATGEKAALARYLDGRVGAVIGTHTHVQTADSRILPKGTAFLTDVGANCAYESILGMRAEPVIKRTATSIPSRFVMEDMGPIQISAVAITFDDNNKATKIHPIYIIE